MSAPPIQKDMAGLLRDYQERINLLERRLQQGIPARLSPGGQQVTDWNKAIYTGFYWADADALNAPFANVSVGQVTVRNTTATPRIMQEVYFPSNTIANQYQTWRRVASDITGTTWTAWTDVNAQDAYTLPGRLAADLPTLGSGKDLNTVVDTGWYIQTSNSNATLALNYPVERAGFLEVMHTTGGSDFRLQTYTEYLPAGSNPTTRSWRRTYYNAVWQPWVELDDFLPKRLEALPPNLASVSDCNAAIEAGWYTSSSAANQPTSTGVGHLMVYRDAGTSIRQEFRRIATASGVQDSRRWSRTSTNNGGAWTPWELLEDDSSGWVTPTLLNGFTGNNYAYRVKNGICYLRGELLNAAVPTALTAFTLPTGFRPSHRLRQVNWASSLDMLVGITVNTSGNVDISCPVLKTSTPGYHINCSFPID